MIKIIYITKCVNLSLHRTKMPDNRVFLKLGSLTFQHENGTKNSTTISGAYFFVQLQIHHYMLADGSSGSRHYV